MKQKQEKRYQCVKCGGDSDMLGYDYNERKWVCAEKCLKGGKYSVKKK